MKDVFGAALLDVQYGDTPADAKPFGEGLPREIWKIVEDSDGNTYRAVYTVKFEGVVYVLHAFQKKSKRGISTPKQDIELIESRLKRAREDYESYLKRKEQEDLK